MPKQGGKFVLSSAEESQLQQLIRAQSTPHGLAQRARVVQLAAQGIGVRAIGGRAGMCTITRSRSGDGAISGGIGALQDEPRSGRKGKISTELLRQIVDQATRPRKAGYDGLAARWLASLVSPRLCVRRLFPETGDTIITDR
jgi:hypothetical protein